ncbi:MAG TPA: SOS response-associated peptidase [Xanthobacteraceae bacterium]|nr:SOS response-associated peptidase [Xanthobacteraceae bacterium]
MCGRAKLPDDVSEIKLDLKIDFDEIDDYRPRWKAAPTSNLPVVISHNRQRILTLMCWGLVPSWATDLKIGYSTFNARAETIEVRSAFRGAWHAGRRCLVIADGYYEWRDRDRQPFAVALGNRGPMTLAGLWDSWRAPDGDTIRSFAIVTTAANDLLAPLHDRMPVLLAPDCWADWLGERPVPGSRLKAMLEPYPGNAMTFWPVDRRVGDVRNDSPKLFAPLTHPAPSARVTIK